MPFQRAHDESARNQIEVLVRDDARRTKAVDSINGGGGTSDSRQASYVLCQSPAGALENSSTVSLTTPKGRQFMWHSIVDHETFDFSNIGDGLTQVFELARAVDVSEAFEAGLNVRIHSISDLSAAGDQYIKVSAYSVWLDEHTGEAFSSENALATIVLGTTSAVGTLISSALNFSTQRPPAVRIVLKAQQATARAAMSVKLSVGLLTVFPR